MAEKEATVVVEEDDDDFELITSERQLGVAPPLRKKEVKVRDWPTASGKGARFLAWELSGGDWSDFMESGRIYKDGAFQRYDTKGEDIRFLAYGLRDQHGNRIWASVDAAKARLEPLGRPIQLLLLNAVNEVNSAKPGSTEGNSEGTPTAS